jgi:hypothetical protein
MKDNMYLVYCKFWKQRYRVQPSKANRRIPYMEILSVHLTQLSLSLSLSFTQRLHSNPLNNI